MSVSYTSGIFNQLACNLILVVVIPITIDGEDLEDVKILAYLGSIIDERGGSDADVKARIGEARAVYLQLKNIWDSKQLSNNIKIRIFNTNVKTVLLDGAKTWRTTKAIIQKIQVFINSCLRKIIRILWPDNISNNLPWTRTNQIPMEEEIKRKRWEWIGHTLRKAPNCVTRQALTWNPQGQRRRGRSKNTLRREMEREMRKMNKNWMELEKKVQDKVSWRLLFGGLFSIRNNRRNRIMISQSHNSLAKGHLRPIINAIKEDDLNTFINATRSVNIFTTFDFDTTEDTISDTCDFKDAQLRGQQAGFRKDRSCTDQIATLRIIVEQSVEWNSSLYINFIDYEKAFDSVDRRTLSKLL
ncbi:unnamed protein product [Schistosoma margrebowiei]|uniref:Uncharacterized protein n=1 Tax=Schistosoma margrebowiei TaxID=48269 RepID=A0A183LBM1_9TREM|nr:unnamed protein product [Schistosoma margrebowiei]